MPVFIVARVIVNWDMTHIVLIVARVTGRRMTVKIHIVNRIS